VPLGWLVQVELQMVLVPFEFGSVKLTRQELARTCKVGEGLHERVWVEVKVSGRTAVRRVMLEICSAN
jgi:hypothetical protein